MISMGTTEHSLKTAAIYMIMTTQGGTGKHSLKFLNNDILTNLERLKKHEPKYKTGMT